MSTSTVPSYSAWKTKTILAKPLNIASFTDFPDLSEAPAKRKDVFAGISLADRLKETIAEEEAFQIRRMKREEKEAAWFRAHCVALPLKGYTGPGSDPETKKETTMEEDEDEEEEGTSTRIWMHEQDAEPIVTQPPFRPSSLLQQRRLATLKRLQLHTEDDNYRWQVTPSGEDDMDRMSVPSLPDNEEDSADVDDDDSRFDNHE